MQDLDYVLDFTVNMVREMLVSGANLERTNLMVEKILLTYGMHDISIFSLTTHVRVAGYAEDGSYWSRQVDVPPVGTHLERLRQLNDLSYRVCKEKPDPARLEEMFRKACQTKEYPWWILLIGQVVALFTLTFIMGGVMQDAAAVILVTIALFFIEAGLSRSGLAYILKDVIGMWAATMLAFILYRLGLGNNIDRILITLCFLLIPGIPLVNAVRNLLCGNEINGIFQLARVILESTALLFGIYLGITIMGGYVPWNHAVVHYPAALMVLLSFFSSVGFGIGFHIWGKNLILAGIGGALTRIVLICLSQAMEERFLYMILAALAASFYGEILAIKFHVPSTYYIYPAIVPLIPGDLFFYAILGIIAQNWTLAASYGWECLKALLGMSLGFVISSSVMHYIRRRNVNQVALQLIRPAAMVDQKLKGKVHTVDEKEKTK